ncbi:MAG: hypothetical protein EOM20_06070 [Spartobacteria bacterium]|nr:hypothetical protein [Spartobacteria bacterium]
MNADENIPNSRYERKKAKKWPFLRFFDRKWPIFSPFTVFSLKSDVFRNFRRERDKPRQLFRIFNQQHFHDDSLTCSLKNPKHSFRESILGMKEADASADVSAFEREIVGCRDLTPLSRPGFSLLRVPRRKSAL